MHIKFNVVFYDINFWMLYSVAEGYDAARGVLPNNRLKYLNNLIPTKSYKEYTMTISPQKHWL